MQDMINKIAQQVMEQLKETNRMGSEEARIPIGVSARHVHLSQADLETLFGKGYELTIKKYIGEEGSSL